MSSHNLSRARTGSVGPGPTNRLDRAVGRHLSGAHRGRAGGGFAIWWSTRWTLIDSPTADQAGGSAVSSSLVVFNRGRYLQNVREDNTDKSCWEPVEPEGG